MGHDSRGVHRLPSQCRPLPQDQYAPLDLLTDLAPLLDARGRPLRPASEPRRHLQSLRGRPRGRARASRRARLLQDARGGALLPGDAAHGPHGPAALPPRAGRCHQPGRRRAPQGGAGARRPGAGRGRAGGGGSFVAGPPGRRRRPRLPGPPLHLHVGVWGARPRRARRVPRPPTRRVLRLARAQRRREDHHPGLPDRRAVAAHRRQRLLRGSGLVGGGLHGPVRQAGHVPAARRPPLAGAFGGQTPLLLRACEGRAGGSAGGGGRRGAAPGAVAGQGRPEADAAVQRRHEAPALHRHCGAGEATDAVHGRAECGCGRGGEAGALEDH
mmetsp:Transcript_86776/g.269788  ORF Transcript_86776/g.269788 Transcript_86776/m.269788 type:complete len:328 (-) Transcript_86776:544-1527(-)